MIMTPQPLIVLTVASLLLASLAMTYPWLVCERRVSPRAARLALIGLAVAEFGITFGTALLPRHFSLSDAAAQFSVMSGASLVAGMLALARVVGDQADKDILLYYSKKGESPEPSIPDAARESMPLSGTPRGWMRFLAAHIACAVGAAALVWGGVALFNRLDPLPQFAIHPAPELRHAVVVVDPPVTFLGEGSQAKIVETWRGKQIVQKQNQRRIIDSRFKRLYCVDLREVIAEILLALAVGMIGVLAVAAVVPARPWMVLLVPYLAIVSLGLGLYWATQFEHVRMDARLLSKAVIYQTSPDLTDRMVPFVDRRFKETTPTQATPDAKRSRPAQ